MISIQIIPGTAVDLTLIREKHGGASMTIGMDPEQFLHLVELAVTNDSSIATLHGVTVSVVL